ncbi:MAG: hypothetical protein RMK89_13730, partial [Armatimonadota bacterium]|nr:hypothetical protein [Armatimonadota bacterium]MDW8144506.1 hypothetical protein [Armatimonadota bacterium]
MRFWLTILTLTTMIAVSGAQTPLTIQWLSFVRNSSNTPSPISVNGTLTDSRFASVTADGKQIVFQVGSGANAQIWGILFDADGDGRVWEDPVDGNDNDRDGRTDEDPPQEATPFLDANGQPISGLHPVISADGNYIAFASLQSYSRLDNSQTKKQQVYILDRQQNRIVPISMLWVDSDGDGIRDDPQV